MGTEPQWGHLPRVRSQGGRGRGRAEILGVSAGDVVVVVVVIVIEMEEYWGGRARDCVISE